MSDNEKLYTIIEISEATGAPRTTINDWLARHSQYIEFKTQGKRKLYTESALQVLKEISELRDKGLSSFDIEKELAKNHPLHAAVVEEPPRPSDPPKQEEPPRSRAAASPLPRKALSLPRAPLRISPSWSKKHYDDIGKLLTEQLHNLNSKMDDIERKQAESQKRAARVFAAVSITVPVLVLLSFWALFTINSQISRERSLSEQNSALAVKLAREESQKAQIEQTAVRLEKTSEMFQKNIEKLKSEQAVKEAEFAKSLENAEQSAQTKVFEARNKFAEEQLERLKKIVSFYADSPAAAEKLIQEYTQGLPQAQAAPPAAPAPATPAPEIKAPAPQEALGAGEK